MAMSEVRAGSETGEISTLTLNSYTLLPIWMRTQRLFRAGMTTTFGFMTNDLT
jgi:hypothetical protein